MWLRSADFWRNQYCGHGGRASTLTTGQTAPQPLPSKNNHSGPLFHFHSAFSLVCRRKRTSTLLSVWSAGQGVTYLIPWDGRAGRHPRPVWPSAVEKGTGRSQFLPCSLKIIIIIKNYIFFNYFLNADDPTLSWFGEKTPKIRESVQWNLSFFACCPIRLRVQTILGRFYLKKKQVFLWHKYLQVSSHKQKHFISDR